MGEPDMDSARKEVELFFQSTSAKGIPRVAKTEHTGYRVFWLICTLMCYGLGAYTVGTVWRAYFSHGTVTNYEEVYKEAESILSQLPAITICDNMPFPHSRSEGLSDTVNYTEYLNKVASLEKCTACTDEKMSRIKNRLSSRKGYYQFLSPEEVRKVGHGPEFVSNCVPTPMMGDNYYLSEKPNCEDFYNISEHILPEHFVCYDYTPKDVEKKFAVNGLELLLFLDRVKPGTDPMASRFNIRDSSANGVRLIFHDKHASYTSNDNYIDLDPGQLVDIKLQLTQYVRKDPPHGKCQNGEGKDSPAVVAALCLTELVTKSCNCSMNSDVPSHYLMQDQNNGPSLEFCENLNLGVETIHGNMDCMEKTLSYEQIVKMCIEDITIPCKETKYTWTLHGTKWPPSGQERSFMQQITMNSGHTNIEKMGNLSEEELQEYVRDNYIKIRIQKRSASFTLITNVEATTLVGVMSSVGGSLNLFCGISMYFFLEIVETCLRICCNTKRSNAGTRSTPVSPTTYTNSKELDIKS